MPFDDLLISWMTNYVSSREFLTCLSFIVYIDRELHSLKSLNLKFGLSSEFSTFFDKLLVRIFLDVLFHVFRFSKASFCALTSSFTAFWNFAAILTLRRTEGCHGNFVISHVKLQINAEILRQKLRSNSSRMILHVLRGILRVSTRQVCRFKEKLNTFLSRNQ